MHQPLSYLCTSRSRTHTICCRHGLCRAGNQNCGQPGTGGATLFEIIVKTIKIILHSYCRYIAIYKKEYSSVTKMRGGVDFHAV